MQRLRSVRHLIVDMDGVLYRGDAPMPGLQAFLAFLRAHDIAFQLVTNNATLSTGMYVKKMARMGVDVPEECVLTSAIAAVDHIAARHPRGSHVYAIGEEGLMDALQQAGMVLSRQDPIAVVVSMDHDITYAKLREATLLIRSGVPFIATNPDLTLPVPEGLVPGAGSIIAAVAAASGQKPLIVGKPEPLLMERAMARMGAAPETTAAVGDRLETDVLSARRARVLSILVLSGASQRAQLAGSEVQPDIVLDDIRSLVAGWQRVLEGGAASTRDR